jgi:hypothetical protein
MSSGLQQHQMVEWRPNKLLRTIPVIIIKELTTFETRPKSVVSSLMTRTEMVLETLVFSPFICLTRLLAREYFIEFSRRESFKLYDLDFIRFDIVETQNLLPGQFHCCLCQTKWYSGRIFQVINVNNATYFSLVMFFFSGRNFRDSANGYFTL